MNNPFFLKEKVSLKHPLALSKEMLGSYKMSSTKMSAEHSAMAKKLFRKSYYGEVIT